MTHSRDILKWTAKHHDAAHPDLALRGANGAKESPAGGSLRNESWPEMFINPRDGSKMRFVPAGEFTMGSTPQDIEDARSMDKDGSTFALLDETPQFDLFVPGFYIGVFAVTNELFARFLSESRPTPALFGLWVYSAPHIIEPGQEGKQYGVEPGFERHPAVHVTWFGASAYCSWAKMRMPTEIEWEKAARGTDARVFPWGNAWHDDYLRWPGGRGSEAETTAPVEAYPEGRSPYGMFQMAGNVSEWCEDWYQAAAYLDHALGHRRPASSGHERVLRGGTCLQRNKLQFRCAMRQASVPAYTAVDFTGIRCACDLPALASRDFPI